jgi:hypothetical protein
MEAVMNQATVDWEEQARLLWDLETAVAADLDEEIEGLPPRLPYDPDPVIWTEWRCPQCHRTFRFDLEYCPHDTTPLEPVEMYQPFLWLG